MNTPLPFEADPCIPADLAPDELSTLRGQRDEILTLTTAATHEGAMNVIRNLQQWQQQFLASTHPSAGITKDAFSLRGKTLVLDGHPIPCKAI